MTAIKALVTARTLRTSVLTLVPTAALLLLAGPAFAEPSLTVTPDSGLSGGQEVALAGSGFSPGVGLGITQCADEEDPDNGIESTEQGDCDIRAIAPVDADARGRVSATYTVSAGPFGENGHVCDATHDCVLALGQLSPEPDAERAVARITFGTPPTPTGSVAPGPLAGTGSTSAPIAGFGAGLAVLGALAMIAARRRGGAGDHPRCGAV